MVIFLDTYAIIEIDRKLKCTTISDCYEKPDLKGCSKIADNCNTCCGNSCTLLACVTLEELGIIPHSKTFEHLIDSAQVFAPNGDSFIINSKKQKVAEVNRRELDKQIAHQAQKNGADIKVKTSPLI